jgi:hypothetical protein
MLVLLSTVTLRYYNCCTDGGTSLGNYGYHWAAPSWILGTQDMRERRAEVRAPRWTLVLEVWSFVYCNYKHISCSWPPLWSSGHSSWLQIQRSGFDSLPYQILREVVGLERGPLSLVSTTEELLERKSSSSGYPQTFALTLPKSCCHSVGIVRSLTKATELLLLLLVSPFE